MCMQFRISRREAAVIIGIGVVISPLLLVGGAVYATVGGVKMGADKIKRRRLNKFWGRVENAKSTSRLQQLWDACNGGASDDTLALLRLAFVLMALGDVRGALPHFSRAVSLESGTGASIAATLYFRARLYAGVGRFAEALRDLNTAQTKVEAPMKAASEADKELFAAAHRRMVDGAHKLGVDIADILGLKAYVILMIATRGREETDYVAVQSAVDLADRAHAADLSNPRHVFVAAWARFANGLRAKDALSVHVDSEQLAAALDCLGRAEELALSAERDALASDAPAAAPVEGTVVQPSAKQVAYNDELSSDDDTDAAASGEAVVGEMVQGMGAGGVSVAEVLSLRAQVLLAMGLIDDATIALARARALDVYVPHSGLLVAPTEEEGTAAADPRLGLLAPWPLASDADSAVTQKNHEFKETRLFKPTWCDQCMGFITQVRAERCKTCKYTVHTVDHKHGDCVIKAKQQQCVQHQGEDARAGDAGVVASHQHVLRVRRIHTPHDCAQCGTFIMLMTQALECNICRVFVHMKCGAGFPNSVVDAPNRY